MKSLLVKWLRYRLWDHEVIFLHVGIQSADELRQPWSVHCCEQQQNRVLPPDWLNRTRRLTSAYFIYYYSVLELDMKSARVCVCGPSMVMWLGRAARPTDGHSHRLTSTHTHTHTHGHGCSLLLLITSSSSLRAMDGSSSCCIRSHWGLTPAFLSVHLPLRSADARLLRGRLWIFFFFLTFWKKKILCFGF